MSDGIVIGGLFLLMVACLVGLVASINADEERLRLAHEKCVKEGQSQWVCDAWVSSERAKRDAGIAMGLAAGSVASSAARR